jgi:hypothetical protein
MCHVNYNEFSPCKVRLRRRAEFLPVPLYWSIVLQQVQDLEVNRKENLTYWAQTDDFLTRYARKTAKIFLSFATKEIVPGGNFHNACLRNY